MVRERIIRQGQVYWLDDCEPLDDDNAKRRPVVVIDVPVRGPVLVVAVSTQKRSHEHDQIKLPSHQDTPRTTSGLPRPTWAVPRWFLPVDRARFGDPVGYISGMTLRRLVDAVVRRIQERSR